MSVINRLPLINEILSSLSTEQLSSLRDCINGQGDAPIFRSLKPVASNHLTADDKGVKPIQIEPKVLLGGMNVLEGYLVYTDDLCYVICVSGDKNQSLGLLHINPTTCDAEFVNGALTILELRSELDDALEAEAEANPGTKLYKHKLVIVFAGTTYNGSTTKSINLHYLSPSSKEPVTIDNYKTALRASDIIGVDGWTFTLSGNIGWFQKIENKLRTSGTTQTGDYEFTSEEYGIQFTSSGIRGSGDSFRSYCSLTLKRADSTFTFSNSSNTNFTAVNSITDTVEEL